MKTGVDRFLVNEFYGVEALASFSLAFQFSALLIMGVTALNLAIVPELNTMLLSRNIKQAKQILRLGYGVILLGGGIVFGIGTLSIEHFYAGKFQSVDLLFPLFLLSIIPQSFVLLLTNVLYFTDNKAFVAKSVVLISVCQALFNLAFIDFLAMIGLIYSNLTFNILLYLVILFKTNEVFKGTV
jgi:O-antigen/teichoic acid export membrane protein